MLYFRLNILFFLWVFKFFFLQHLSCVFHKNMTEIGLKDAYKLWKQNEQMCAGDSHPGPGTTHASPHLSIIGG
jgi:hypothetical protein